ncbi:hypothetical protein HAZT_HAZT002267 [Hyalella azteca]|uniref:VWFA domain-containing protein n=1 Tax=Hyalella azteca TaxID=294128 RepID=A0A6A0GYI9_HYAAZ|nr:hypothetical protein HAZT_HAZT002267 [Hyalella azteca]
MAIQFINYQRKACNRLGRVAALHQLPSSVRAVRVHSSSSKVSSGANFKGWQVSGQAIELVFLVDSSSSVGADNFLDELKFVKKLLADFTVSYNQTRVAVITFSSQDRVKVEVDHVSSPHPHNHKCVLLEWQMPRIRFMGGGTYTMGAMLEAQRVLAASRRDSVKAVFLVTDGYSNGGDPRPAAEALKRHGVTIFTFGIRNGNVEELYDMASHPREEHSYILESFEEFEALARRALHEDGLASGPEPPGVLVVVPRGGRRFLL